MNRHILLKMLLASVLSAVSGLTTFVAIMMTSLPTYEISGEELREGLIWALMTAFVIGLPIVLPIVAVSGVTLFFAIRHKTSRPFSWFLGVGMLEGAIVAYLLWGWFWGDFDPPLIIVGGIAGFVSGLVFGSFVSSGLVVDRVGATSTKS